MVNALWEIDGHHDVFKARNMPNPSTLDPFTVYYIPELSTFQAEFVIHITLTLPCLQEVYCDWQGWKGLKQTVEGLPISLSGYASYLNARSWIWYTHQNIQFVSYQKTFHLTTFLAALPHHHALVVLSQSYTRSTCWSMCSLRVFVQVSHTWSINTYRLWRPMGCLQTQWC